MTGVSCTHTDTEGTTMCSGCVQVSIENIVDVMIKGYELDVATRLYRDAVMQRALMDTPEGSEPAEKTLYDARKLCDFIRDASDALALTKETRPEVYEGLLMTRTLLSMISGCTDGKADEDASDG